MDPRLLLADAILLLHVAFIAFVVIGQMLIVIGLFRRWGWVRNIRFRLSHLAAIGFVVVQAWLGGRCPLTQWEGDLRHAAGERFYEGGFIAYWMHRAIYYEAEPRVFTLVYTAFGAIVLGTLIAAPPRKGRA